VVSPRAAGSRVASCRAPKLSSPPAGLIHICLRATLDWGDEGAFWAQLDPRMKEKVDAWNRAFDMPYHRFRERIKAIAQLSLRRVRGAVLSDWESVPIGAWVLPVDDDDWFAPDAAEKLSELRGADWLGCTWPRYFLEVPWGLRDDLAMLLGRWRDPRPELWFCGTNNYAFVKDDDNRVVYRSHASASKWFTRPGAPVGRLAARLSVTNRTIASQTSFGLKETSVGRARLLWKFLRYRRLYERSLPSELAWSRPYLELMSELMNEVHLRRPSFRRAYG
jgi:hypothetical protein